MDIQNIIESQKEAARDLWFHLLQPLLQQKHSEQGAQDHIQAALEELPASLGNLCLCSVTYIVKKWFLMFRRNLLCSSLFLFSHQKRDVGFIFFSSPKYSDLGFQFGIFWRMFFFSIHEFKLLWWYVHIQGFYSIPSSNACWALVVEFLTNKFLLQAEIFHICLFIYHLIKFNKLQRII